MSGKRELRDGRKREQMERKEVVAPSLMLILSLTPELMPIIYVAHQEESVRNCIPSLPLATSWWLIRYSLISDYVRYEPLFGTAFDKGVEFRSHWTMRCL